MVIENGILSNVTEEDIVNGTFIVPEGVTKIDNFAFRRLEELEKVVLPSTLTSIGENAFMSCKDLKEINIPESVTEIGKGAFMSCTKLSMIKLPDTITSLNDSMFMNCISLKDVKLPKNLDSIPQNTFYECPSLETIELPSNVKTIGSNAFTSCRKLKSINLPKNLIEIKANAFSSCKSLEDVILPDGLKYIDDSAFHGCSGLITVNMPDSVEYIGENCFNSCHKLENIKLSNKLEIIPNGALCECDSLTSIIIPDSVKILGKESIGKCQNLTSIKLSKNLEKIENDAIWACTNLKSVEIPDSVTYLGEGVFNCCYALEEVKLPNNIPAIRPVTFSHCKSLKSITIPESVTEINGHAFYNCSALENINFSDNITQIDRNCFQNCTSLTDIVMPKSLTTFDNTAFKGCESLKSIKFYNNLVGACPKYKVDLKFLKKDDDGFTLQSEQTNETLPVDYLKINIPFLVRNWDKKELLFREQNDKKILNFYNMFLAHIDITKAQEFMENHNFKFFKQFEMDTNIIRLSDEYLYKILYNLGAFNTPIIDEKGKKIDYAQKVCTFLQQKVEEGYFEIISDFADFGKDMEVNGFNKEFTDFFLQYFDEIHEQEYYNPGFLARCYNEFDEVQKTNTNNRGSQRQLKPTFKKFVEFFSENKFSGITEETKGIADAISPYFTSQETFDLAKKIDEERRNNNIPNHILSVHLKENPFDKIDKITSAIQDEQLETAANLTKTAKNEFTYEWLAKNDPENFILGKLCSCCAHIEGNGQGIMRASIIHPNIQNLVIRNDKGEIIAKSTLYLNRDEGYGVFNNVEVYNDINENDYPKIYEKYMLGVKKFAEQYNKENPDKPLQILTVGMHLNDLKFDLREKNIESYILYPAINYSKYNINGEGHIGDSSRHQQILWKNKPKQKIINEENNLEK